MTEIMLVPLDGSPVSESVLPLAAAVAAACNLEMRLFGVVEPATRGLTERSERIATALETEAHDRLEGRFTALSELLRTRGLPVSHRLLRGNPASCILNAANEPDVDLIAMATHGYGGAERWALGSVADKVMRLAQRPTLLFHPPYQPYPLTPRTLQRLLVPLDGSALAEEALDVARPLAEGAGAALVLVRVEPWVTEGLAPPGAVPEYVAREEAAAQQAGDYLTTVRGRLGPEEGVDGVVLRGRAADALIGYAQHEGVDLIVMTTRGRGGVRRFVLGSTAERLMRSGVPVLLVRPAPAR